MLRIEHNRKLLGPLGVLTRHDRARMRSVRNSAWMEGDRGRLDPAPRPEITAHIKQNFVGFDIIVDPRNFDSLGVRIEQARRESTDDVAADFKCLMNGRRLMHCSGNRLKVLSVKSKGVNVTVPP